MAKSLPGFGSKHTAGNWKPAGYANRFRLSTDELIDEVDEADDQQTVTFLHPLAEDLQPLHLVPQLPTAPVSEPHPQHPILQLPMPLARRIETSRDATTYFNWFERNEAYSRFCYGNFTPYPNDYGIPGLYSWQRTKEARPLWVFQYGHTIYVTTPIEAAFTLASKRR